MYQISIYFDEPTHNRINQLITRVAKATGNETMTEGNIPPHITISTINCSNEKQLIKAIEKVIPNLKTFQVQWVSVGTFKQNVIFLTPILNKNLQELSQKINAVLEPIRTCQENERYMIYNWFPHTTIGKHLDKEQIHKAFLVANEDFSMIKGTAVSLGISKTKPYENVRVWNL